MNSVPACTVPRIGASRNRKSRALTADPVPGETVTSPAGRAGWLDDIAHAYLYCLAQPSPTGSILTVDGGTVLA